MSLPDSAYHQFTPDLKICRLLNGMWQVSGAHGPINLNQAAPAMVEYHDAGYYTWDLADHYGPAEDLIGAFRRYLIANRGIDSVEGIQTFTKWVPQPGRMTHMAAESAVEVSLRRMDASVLDLMQFHWWDYRDDSYLDALKHLSDLRDAGKIRHIALTNFDTKHLQTIVDAGIHVVSNQVQFSLIDRRPEVHLIDYCKQRNVKLLTYGTVAGGFLSEKYLGQPDPDYDRLNTASLRKYKQMIDTWGGWKMFQELLRTLKEIADRHGVSIANVATRYILDKPMVAGVILGARLGVTEHRDENLRVFSLKLDSSDIEKIHAATEKAKDLFRLIGDCGAEYRR
jgi:aryl-alcohol dehydrogenase-like predicted oxidoreductase